MGIDLQVAVDRSGEIAAVPYISIYVRMLPPGKTNDPRHDMVPRSELSRETRQAVEDRAREYINEAIAALPPVAEASEPTSARETRSPRPNGRATSPIKPNSVSQKRESLTPMRVGQNRAAQTAALRAEEIAAARRQGAQERLAARRQRNGAVAAIGAKPSTARLRTLVSVFAKRERELRTPRTVTADDLAADLGSEESQAGTPSVFGKCATPGCGYRRGRLRNSGGGRRRRRRRG